MISGKVVHGDGVGYTLGYPTANLDISPKKTKLEFGVYAARVIVNHLTYMAALVITNEPAKVEVYLLDFPHKELYGCVFVVDPIQRVSGIEKQDTKEKLKKKIADDILLVREVLEDT